MGAPMQGILDMPFSVAPSDGSGKKGLDVSR